MHKLLPHTLFLSLCWDCRALSLSFSFFFFFLVVLNNFLVLATRAHWFIRADDDTYINMDNMRLYLSSFDPTKPVWLGRLLYGRGEKDQVS